MTVHKRLKQMRVQLLDGLPDYIDPQLMYNRGDAYAMRRFLIMKRLHDEGFSNSEIAAAFDKKPSTVSCALSTINGYLSIESKDTKWIIREYRQIEDILGGYRTVRLNDVEAALDEMVEMRKLTPEGRNIIKQRLAV